MPLVKITLIISASEIEVIRLNEPFMPLSLPLLASAAPEHEYTLIDLLSNDKVNFDDPVDLVGISTRISGEERAYFMADEFRKRGIAVVLGGAQPTAVYKIAKEHADSVVVGEGELVWPILLDDFSKGVLKDFYITGPAEVDESRYTVYRNLEYNDLQNISIPARHFYKNKKYHFDTVFAARGCSVQCDFCSVSTIFGTKFRLRPVADVADEIDTLGNYYYLLDDTVLGKSSTYDYYLDLYHRLSNHKQKRFWIGQANLDAASNLKGRSVIEAARDAGLIYAAIGMESINPVVLKKCGASKKMGAGLNTDIIKIMKDNIRFFQNCGILVSGWFVVGYEEDSIDTYYRTLEFCDEMDIIPAIFPLRVLSGTTLYSRLKNEGRLTDSLLYNVMHPELNEMNVCKTLIDINRKGFSIAKILSRTQAYIKHVKSDKIHKAIFSCILQYRLKYGVNVAIPFAKKLKI